MAEAGVINGCFALNYGIIMVQYKAGVFQHLNLPSKVFYIIPNLLNSGNAELFLAYYEQMCYNTNK
jgi:hypothetical protein